MKIHGILAAALGAVFMGAALASPAVAQEKTDLQTIVENKKVRLGAPISDPYYIKEPGSTEWTGLVPDIARLIFGNVGVTVEFVPTEWGTAVAGLQSGRFDLMGAFDATPERGLVVDFSDPIGNLDTGVLTLAGNKEKYAEWEVLNSPDVRIAAVDGVSSVLATRPLLPNATWILVPKYENAFLEIQSGRADVVLGSAISLAKFASERGAGEIVIPKPYVGVPTSFGLRKSYPSELKNWLNLSLAYADQRGEIDAIWRKYTDRLGIQR